MCPTRQVLTARGLCSTCDDACTGDLLRGLEDLAFDLEVGASKTVGGVLEAPWAVLEGIHAEAKGARVRLDALRTLADKAGEVQSELRKPANQAVKEVRSLPSYPPGRAEVRGLMSARCPSRRPRRWSTSASRRMR